MIIGDPSKFALESEVSKFYGRLSFRGLGFFRIHLGGVAYGVKAPNATLLACSFDQVRARLDSRGTHQAPFSLEPEAINIANSVLKAVFGAVGADVPLSCVSGSLRDIQLQADSFYDLLNEWWRRFDADWRAAPKEPEE